jgi:hypothetical protein
VRDAAALAACSLSPPRPLITCNVMPDSAPFVRQHRARQRAKGLRPVQFWLPDTRTRRFAAQVARDIAAVSRLSTEDDAMLDAFERVAAEDLQECD